jgi:hypothetical protein
MESVSVRDKFVRQINSEVEAEDEYILTGAYVTLEQYKAAVARRTALVEAREMYLKILRRAESEDEHDV